MASRKVQEFIEKLAPSAIAIGEKYGLDPGLILAQSALETGWGDSVAGNNYFGVKSHGQPGGISVQTHEEIGGKLVPVTDSFRAYGGVTESMEDYARFLRDNPRYSDVFNKSTLADQIDAVAAAGYATDSQYAPKLHAVAGMIDLSPYTGRLPPIAQAPAATPALAAINRAAPAPAAKPGIMGGIGHALMGGVNSLQATANQALPSIQAKTAQVTPEAIMRALSTVQGRTAIGKYLMNKNISKAPDAVAGNVMGGTPVMAVNNQGRNLMTLMRSGNQPGGASSRGFDAKYHQGQNMDIYRANRAAIGDRITQANINQALMRGSTLYRRRDPDEGTPQSLVG